MKNDIFRIHINIGGCRLPLNIARKDEELYRRAEKKLNAILDKRHKEYDQRSSEEILTIAAYQLAVAFCRQEMSKDVAPILKKIEALGQELDNVSLEKE